MGLWDYVTTVRVLGTRGQLWDHDHFVESESPAGSARESPNAQVSQRARKQAARLTICLRSTELLLCIITSSLVACGTSLTQICPTTPCLIHGLHELFDCVLLPGLRGLGITDFKL